ncbi:MAG: ATP-binding cassette domain-containing protein [Sandaracinaceae bacterium]
MSPGVAFDEVRATGLVKLFGATAALRGVDLRLRGGEVTVIEGPNGSGKSTLLGILAQLLRPTRGEVRYGAGAAAPRPGPALRRHLGVLAHAAMVYPDLTANENLRLYARLHRLSAAEARVAEARERFGIGRFGDRPARTYSRGQLQRLALARALLNSPSLLLLDEPSTGLDHRTTARLIEAVEAERARGAIVALITHDPGLAERLADRRVTLRRGQVVDAAGAGGPA